jgi:hypothetical protein
LDVVGVTGKHRLASVADLAGADRVEKLPDDLAEYDEIDLLDLLDVEETAGGGGVPAPEGADGPLVAEVVDLFGARRQAWLRTWRGVWFIPAGDKIMFLAPDEEVGRYRVARVDAGGAGGEFLESGIDLEMAMSWAEVHATKEAGKRVHKSAKWRKRAPSREQLTVAARMGVPTEGRTWGDMHDALSVAITSQQIDRMPCVATVTERGYW